VLHLAQPLGHALRVAGPELAHAEDVAALLPQILHPLVGEALREVLHGVEPEPFQPEFLGDPNTPVLDILFDFWVRVVNVGEHHVISVCQCVRSAFRAL
jgi:hypothetical protein